MILEVFSNLPFYDYCVEQNTEKQWANGVL